MTLVSLKRRWYLATNPGLAGMLEEVAECQSERPVVRFNSIYVPVGGLSFSFFS